MLVVSQFTLLGDCRRGRRPDFTAAAPPEAAERLYQLFVDAVAEQGVPVATGRFRQHMEVELVNDGPVTLVVESRRVKQWGGWRDEHACDFAGDAVQHAADQIASCDACRSTDAWPSAADLDCRLFAVHCGS